MSQRHRLARLLVLVGGAFAAYSAYAWYAMRRLEDLEPQSAGAPGSFLDVDGVRIHYVEAGQGPPVVLIHGWNASTFSFRYTIPELARDHRVVALDLKGYGYSDRPAEGDYSLATQAELVQRVMDRLGIDRADVIGHSMGGAVAMRLAVQHPELVSRVVLVDSVTMAEFRRAIRFGRLLKPLLPLAAPLALHRDRVGRAVFRTAVHDPAHLTTEVLEGYFRPLRMKGHLRALARQLVDRRQDKLVDPARIWQPTLILWGEHDRWLPLVHGETLARQISNAKLAVVRGAGHLPLEEQPATCNQLLLEFLNLPEEAGEPAQKEAAAKLETAI